MQNIHGLIGAVVLAAAAAGLPTDGPASGPPAPVPAQPLAPPPRAIITRPDWDRVPDFEVLAEHFPPDAQELELSGRAVIECAVSAAGLLTNCQIVSEAPAGFGFGRATLQVARYFKMRPMMINGAPVEGGKVRVPVNWRNAVEEPHVRTVTAAKEPAALRRWRLPAFPAGVQETGAQGDVLVRASLDASGAVTQAQVAKSSGVDALDAAAVSAVSAWTFEPAQNRAGEPIAATVEVRIPFDSDTPNLVLTKSCRQANAEAAWRAKASPRQDPAHGPLFSISFRLLRKLKVLGGSGAYWPDHEERQKWFDAHFDAAFTHALELCSAAPDRKYFEVLTEALGDYPGKQP
jgi:TonB family protein